MDDIKKMRKKREELLRKIMNGKGRIEEVEDIIKRRKIKGFKKINRRKIRGNEDGLVIYFKEKKIKIRLKRRRRERRKKKERKEEMGEEEKERKIKEIWNIESVEGIERIDRVEEN